MSDHSTDRLLGFMDDRETVKKDALPCRFCRSPAQLGRVGARYRIDCSAPSTFCSAQPRVSGRRLEEALILWNTRASDASQPSASEATAEKTRGNRYLMSRSARWGSGIQQSRLCSVEFQPAPEIAAELNGRPWHVEIEGDDLDPDLGEPGIYEIIIRRIES